ncbi:MAG: hypothetical protein KF819_14635 [Labilithrix sp.]|nr:hypothetical protein [Labilithrix sp.]
MSLHRIVFVCAFVLGLFTARSAFAESPSRELREAASAIVRVEAYEHATLGVVVGDGRLVLVPFATIEVDRPGFPHAIVVDAEGTKHAAGLAATDRASGLALLAVERPITKTPRAPSPFTLDDAPQLYAIVDGSRPSAEHPWTTFTQGMDVVGGSPIVDSLGRVVAIASDGAFFIPRPMAIPRDAWARLDGSDRRRRSWIFYGGTSAQLNFARDGGLWFGATLSFAARYRDQLDLRLDAGVAALVPVSSRKTDGPCPCYAGVRAFATPSVGYRVVVGDLGSRGFPIALTPSIGVAMGAQDVIRDNGATAFDDAAPRAWARAAPGLSLAIWVFELRARLRSPRRRRAAVVRDRRRRRILIAL